MGDGENERGDKYNLDSEYEYEYGMEKEVVDIAFHDQDQYENET